MQMAEQFDISTLAWVKGEIDETLKQARIALEAFVEDPNDEAQLQFCITYIHQVYGTLHMVELAGAAMFAEEVEAFATAIQQGAIENKELAYELLMRAILQLPDYLEGLMAGQNDNPAGLVPLLNELRQLRGDKALDSSDFFRPDLSIAPPPRKERPAAGVDSTVAAKKLHRYYLAALAKVLKGVDIDANLKALATVLEKLYAIGERDNWRRMLWISSALIEGMREGAIELARETKPLLGKIEQAIKSVAVKGEAGLSEEVLNKLYPLMLYRLALSNAQGKYASAVREAFRLERYLPQGSGLGGVTAELKQTVSADIVEELSRVKDTFDVFVRSDRKKINDLEQMANSLVSIADTLNVLQEEKLQQSLQSQTVVIRQLLAGEVEPSDETLMGIAGAILAVESALRDWGNTTPVVEADAREEQVADTENAPEAAAEHQRVTRQVMKESRDDLIKIREAINTYLEKPQDKHLLEGLPSMLHMIIGSLNLLSYKRVAQVLASCSVFIERELINSAVLPGDEKLDALADAVMSVEYYLEAFVQSRVHPTSVLEVAENAVIRLGYPVGTIEGSADSEIAAPEIEGIDVFESAETEAENPAEKIAVENFPTEEFAEQWPAVEEPVIEEPAASELSFISDTESDLVEPVASEVAPPIPEVEEEPAEEPVVTPGSEIPAQAPAATKPSASVEIDDEILEIFIEEAEEELNNIRTLLPKWKESTGDDEALKDLRRSFHTLKGSGRLVGAVDLGEFAWAFENLLNRVIDGTVSPSATMFDMLDQAVDCLQELVLQFKEGTAPQCDAEMLREMAFEIVQPGGISMPVPSVQEPVQSVPEPTAVVEQSQQQEVPSGEVPELDPILLEIYSKEAEGHLDELDAFVANYQAGGSHKASEPLIRALHTLQGSSRMAGVVSVADICAKLEKYAKTLQATGELVNGDGINAIQACTEYTRLMLAFLLDRTGKSLPDSQRAQQLADDVFAAVQHMEDAAHARPEAGLAYKEEIETSSPEPQIEPEVSPSPVEPADSGIANKINEPVETRESGTTLSGAQQSLVNQGPGTTAESVASDNRFNAPVFEPEAPAVQPVESEAQSLTFDEEYDPELLEIFLEEGVDILDASEETLQGWVEHPEDRSLVQSLQRQLHTLKGGARMAGIEEIGDLSHSLETVFDAVVDGLIERSPEMIDLLQLSHDRLVTMLEQVKKHEPITSGDDLISKVEALAHGEAVEETATPAPAPVAPDIKLVKPAEPITPVIQTEAVEPVNVKPAVIEPDTTPSGLPEIAPDLSVLEQAIADVEYNLTTLVRDFTDRALFENLRKSGLRLAEISREIDIAEVVELTDALVLLLSAINDGHVASSKKSTDLMMLTLDRVRLMLNQVKSLEPIENSGFLAADIKELISSSVAAEEGSGVTDNVAAVEDVTVEAEKEEESDNRRKAPRIQHEVVRVRSDLLDNLVNFAGEVSIYRSRVEQQIGSFRGSIDEMDQTVVRLREQIRQVNIETEAQIASRREEVQKSGHEDFDPLEFDRFTHMQQVSRSMMESLSDLVSIEDMLLNLTRESETLLLQQSRVNTELQENLMHTRMVPLSEYAPRLRRIVRQTSSELGKRTNLGFEGAEVEMDRNVVERMMAPLEHMLRNSIAHGIEDLDVRRRAGKPEVGSITINLSREGSEIIVRVRDDGAGINLEAVKKKALERGLMKAGAKLSDKEIMGFILESGFSTAQSLSQIAGRGVGMDVVNSEIKQLGGVLEIDTTQGQGTEFLVRLPLTLSVSRALLVYVDEDIYAIPLLSISGIERIAGSELESLLNQENPTFNWLGEEYDVMHLTNVLGAGSGQVNAEMARVPLLMARSGEHRIAFAIDGLIGSREIVVKSLGPQLSTLHDLAGATILADGSVALIIDMPSLIRRGLARKGGVVAEPEFVEQPEEREIVVMVVDDSITVRKVTERLLKRHSMKCVTAKDGVDALTVLEETIPDVMLLDIEMPRMDGFELATHIRNSDRLKDIPIIMITSRTGEKHRQRAMDIGVNKYMGKPYTEVDLLENIEALVGKQG